MENLENTECDPDCLYDYYLEYWTRDPETENNS